MHLEVRESNSQNLNLIEVLDDTTIQQDDPTEPRRSGRVSHVPERWTGEVFELILDHEEHDPARYGEAITDIDVEFWHEAMKTKINSIHLNQVWDLSQHLKGSNP